MSNETGLRYNSGKAPMEMIPFDLLEGAARVFHDVTTREVNPYPRWNWMKPNEWSVPYACLLRHLFKWYRGEDNDPETGHSHLHHAMCNLLMLIHYSQQYPDRDDRPKVVRNEDAEVGVVGYKGKTFEIVEALPEAGIYLDVGRVPGYCLYDSGTGRYAVKSNK